jgi:hypothetical protein
MDVPNGLTRRGSSSGGRNKGGRPKGSVSLTPEIEGKIQGLIRAGAWGYAAAEAAGVSARTYYEWLARGEGRSPRGSTPKLKAFARRVRQAEAEARVLAEADVFRTRPALWLSKRVRSKPGREGWTEPVEDPDGDGSGAEGPPVYQPSQEELAEIVRVLAEAGVVPTCLDPDCGCQHERSDDDEP